MDTLTTIIIAVVLLLIVDVFLIRHMRKKRQDRFKLVIEKGIIIENGGMLSHASIVAREFEILCVTEVPNAVNILKTGNIVEIDTLSGEIEILKKK